MVRRGRDGFLRRLGRALRGVDAVEYGRPVPTGGVEVAPGPTPTLIVDDPPGPPGPGRSADGARSEGQRGA